MRLIRSNSGNAAHEMVVFQVTYARNNPTKAQLTGQQFIKKFTLFTQRWYDWVCHGPGKSWVFRTRRVFDIRPTLRPQIVNVADTIKKELPRQSIKERPELELDLMNSPGNYHEFINPKYGEESIDPFTYRFHWLENATVEKLQPYLNLTNQYPEYFARVEKATLVTKGKREVTCPGIMGARNEKIFHLYLKCDPRIQIGENLKKYIYTRVKRILELLTENDYVIDVKNLQLRLQFWRKSECDWQLKLAFLNTRDDLPSIENTSKAKKMNKACLKTFCNTWELKRSAEELTPESEVEASINLKEIYAYFTSNTVPISNNLIQ